MIKNLHLNNIETREKKIVYCFFWAWIQFHIGIINRAKFKSVLLDNKNSIDQIINKFFSVRDRNKSLSDNESKEIKDLIEKVTEAEEDAVYYLEELAKNSDNLKELYKQAQQELYSNNKNNENKTRFVVSEKQNKAENFIDAARYFSVLIALESQLYGAGDRINSVSDTLEKKRAEDGFSSDAEFVSHKIEPQLNTKNSYGEGNWNKEAQLQKNQPLIKLVKRWQEEKKAQTATESEIEEYYDIQESLKRNRLL